MTDITAPRPLRTEPRERATRRIKDARAKLAEQALDPISFQYELLVLFARNQLSVGLALPLFSVMLAATAFIWIDWTPLLFWLAGVFVCQGLMLSLCERFERTASAVSQAEVWGRRFAGMEFVSGMAWASLLVIGWIDGNVTSHVFLFAITIINIAVRVTLASQALLIVYAGTLPLATALAARLLLAGEPVHVALAVITITAELYFVWMARRLNQTALQMIALRADKDRLIAELEESKVKAEGAQRRAEDANLAKSRFLATMSHELRTPLNAILGFSEVMKSELLGQHAVKTYKEYANDIHTSGEHLLNLINEILDLSRIEAGRYDLNEARVSVPGLASECHKLMQMRARQKNLSMVESYDDGLPAVWADERAIRQIWLNLLSNAIKFTPPGGAITLRAWQASDRSVHFSVKDSGPGIAQEEIPRILSSFGQGAIARRHSEEGAGLGLPIVKGLAELHGGSLEIQSRLRTGTEMIVTIPPRRVMAGAAVEAAATA